MAKERRQEWAGSSQQQFVPIGAEWAEATRAVNNGRCQELASQALPLGGCHWTGRHRMLDAANGGSGVELTDEERWRLPGVRVSETASPNGRRIWSVGHGVVVLGGTEPGGQAESRGPALFVPFGSRAAAVRANERMGCAGETLAAGGRAGVCCCALGHE